MGGVVAALLLGGWLAWAPESFAQPPAPGGTAFQTGQTISLDLKGVDILDVLKLFSQKSGLNFVAGRNVTGRVTIFVKDVDVWEAFQRLVSANDLAYEQHGAIVTVMLARDYELLYGERFQDRKRDLVVPLKHAKVTQVATVLNQLKSSVGRVVADEATNTLILTDVPDRLAHMQQLMEQLDQPIGTRVYHLNYAKADKLKDNIQQLLSPIGTFTFDERTNTAIVSDLTDLLPKVDRVVRAVDTQDGEVLIEARIINVTLNDATSLGIDWQQIFAGLDFETRHSFSVIGDVIAQASPATGAALRLATSPHTSTTILLEALRTLGKTETLSNPRLTVANNQEAKILVGRKEAFVTVTTTVPATGSTVSAPEIQFVDVGTKLYVTPSIKRDGHVLLKIRPEVSSVSETVTATGGTRIPIVSTTEAETTVLVKSGVTLIIGGLIDNKDDQQDNRVPLLGDLPIVGAPFRSRSTTKKKSELVVFLTPQIIMPDGTAYVAPPAQSPETEELDVPAIVLQEPVSAPYQRAVRSRVQERLAKEFRANSLPTGSVVVSFVLSHDGALIGEPAVTSPEGEAFMRAARMALRDAAPFPPFPEGSKATEVRFRIAADYSP